MKKAETKWMISFLFFLCVASCFSSRAIPSKFLKGMDFHYFDQIVDHFDPLNNATYKQRYLVDKSSWQSGGPVFIFLGGEAPVQFFEFQEVSSRNWAKEFGALYISIEHRYYGESIPTSDYSTENLKYLSSQQALADAANFIVSFNKTLDQAGPWVVFGCSYSGALSAWFRTKYPHLVVGSVAPSGPVFATNNFSDYYNLFQKVADPGCVKAVKDGVSSIVKLLSSDSGRQQLQKTFNTCQAIPSNPRDQYYFLLSLTEAIGGSDQYENPPQWPLNQTCSTLTQSSNYLQNWAKLVAQENECLNIDEKSSFLDPLRDTSSQDRSWFFQKCTEFGFFKPTDTSVFFPGMLTLEHQLSWCEQIFGIANMKPHIEFTNAYYGGFDVSGTNILFTNGDFDPWHELSINKDISSGVKAVTYAAGHCAPMTEPTSGDPVSLKNARELVKEFLNSLLS